MVTIREAKIEDAVGIATVHIASWREAYRGIVPDEFLKNLSVERRVSQWTNSLSDPGHVHHHAIVAEVNGQVVGFSNYGFAKEPDENYRGELFAIYILRSVQKRGVGRLLVNAAVAGLRGLGLDSMMVWVLKDNQARGFYERLGGVLLRETSIEIGGLELLEVAYGWQSLTSFRDG